MKPSFDIISDITSLIESSHNPDAIRFEPSVYDHLTKGPGLNNPAKKEIVETIIKVHGCSLETACMIFSTSFGLFQIMGENIYSVCDYKRSIGWFFSDNEAQEECFLAFLKSIGFPDGPDFDDSNNLAKYALHYNGPGDIQAYCKKLLETYQSEYK